MGDGRWAMGDGRWATGRRPTEDPTTRDSFGRPSQGPRQATRRRQTTHNARFQRSRRIAADRDVRSDRAGRPTFRAFSQCFEEGCRAVPSRRSPSISNANEIRERSRAF